MYYVLRIMRRIFLGLFLPVILTTCFILQTTTPVYAANCDPNIPGDCPAGLQQIENLFRQIISVMVGLGFIALLVLLIFAGFKYLTSGGEQKAVQAAHQTVTWALLGIVFMAVAWIVLQLIKTFTGVDVTTFNIVNVLK